MLQVKIINTYGTDLMQCCTRMQETGYHLPSAWTQLSKSFNWPELELERKPRGSSLAN